MSNRYTFTYYNHIQSGCTSKSRFLLPANIPLDVVKALPKDIKSGVYFGWASVDSGQVYKAVLNIGWCPFYDNNERSVVIILISHN